MLYGSTNIGKNVEKCIPFKQKKRIKNKFDPFSNGCEFGNYSAITSKFTVTLISLWILI
jgi:hypothetical protein